MNSDLRKTILTIVLVLVIAAGLAWWHFRSQFWLPIKAQNVSVDSVPLPDARVFRLIGSDDVMLYTPPESRVREWYVVRVSVKEVGWVPNNRFWFVSSMGVLVKDHTDPSVNVYSPKMNKHDPQLRLSVRSADFTGLDGEKIHLEWQ